MTQQMTLPNGDVIRPGGYGRTRPATATRGTHAMQNRYFARSASDKTDDWPYWFVADRQRGGLNVTAELIREHIDMGHKGVTLFTRNIAESIADIANKAYANA